jgi:hypothetical protein
MVSQCPKEIATDFISIIICIWKHSCLPDLLSSLIVQQSTVKQGNTSHCAGRSRLDNSLHAHTSVYTCVHICFCAITLLQKVTTGHRNPDIKAMAITLFDVCRSLEFRGIIVQNKRRQNKIIANLMQQSLTSGAHLVRKFLAHLLLNSKAHYYVHKSPTPVPICDKWMQSTSSNPIYILPSTPWSPKLSLSFSILTKTLCALLSLTRVVQAPPFSSCLIHSLLEAGAPQATSHLHLASGLRMHDTSPACHYDLLCHSTVEKRYDLHILWRVKENELFYGALLVASLYLVWIMTGVPPRHVIAGFK